MDVEEGIVRFEVVRSGGSERSSVFGTGRLVRLWKGEQVAIYSSFHSVAEAGF